MRPNKTRKLPLLSAAFAIGALSLLGTCHTNDSRIVSAMTAGADASVLYASRCSICHGRSGAGTQSWRSKGQPDFTDAAWQKSRTDAQLTESITNGKGKYMPAFKAKLSNEDVGKLVGYVRALGRKK